jgi:hypothetical protein
MNRRKGAAKSKRVLALQNGPCIPVGHSYGGAVITEAGTDSSVAGLVYVTAHMPDEGENEADDGKRFPSDIARGNAGVGARSGYSAIGKSSVVNDLHKLLVKLSIGE